MDTKKIFSSFQKQTVLIIGDIMLDSYITGKIERMSPEAPVPVVSVTGRDERLGGAANVALNIQALGAKPIVCAVFGNDHNGKTLQKLFRSNKLSTEGLLALNNRPTTVKTRIISNNKHIIRLDEETLKDISSTEEKKLFAKISSVIQKQKISIIIFEDYNKGCITSALISQVVNLAVSKNIPVAVDPKKKNFLGYKNATLFKPNLKELKEGIKKLPTDATWKTHRLEIEKAVENLRKTLKAKNILLTLSENGMFITNGNEKFHIPAGKRNIIDVSGAGDTVISVAALCLSAGCGLREAAELANLAGGLVCEKTGVVPVNMKSLKKEASAL